MTPSTEAQVGTTFRRFDNQPVGTIVARFDSIGATLLALSDANRRWRETGKVHPTFTLDDGVAVVVREGQIDQTPLTETPSTRRPEGNPHA